MTPKTFCLMIMLICAIACTMMPVRFVIYFCFIEHVLNAVTQDYHYRIIVGDIYATNKNIMEYENWSPISADHHYLNPVGRQYEAEQDEKEIVNVSSGKRHFC